MNLDAFCKELGTIAFDRDVSMKKKTSFAIGGPADVLVEAHSNDETVQVLSLCKKHALPLFVLGGGSNLLVGDGGIRGVVLTLGGALKNIEVLDEGRRIIVGAAATYPKLTRVALDLGWPSAVGWMGTPGRVGGALKMNAGAKEGELGEVVHEVFAASAEGSITFDHAACGFGYRSSHFPDDAVLTSAILQCDARKTEEAVELDRVAKNYLKRRHTSQPKLRSAGSIFKNPEGDYAGRLIEAVGLKGQKRGGASISDVHANFVVNHKGASAADVVWLAELAQEKVKATFGVELQWEVRRVGEFT